MRFRMDMNTIIMHWISYGKSADDQRLEQNQLHPTQWALSKISPSKFQKTSKVNETSNKTHTIPQYARQNKSPELHHTREEQLSDQYHNKILQCTAQQEIHNIFMVPKGLQETPEYQPQHSRSLPQSSIFSIKVSYQFWKVQIVETVTQVYSSLFYWHHEHVQLE